MKLGIAGYPNSGKKTLYKLLTGNGVPESSREAGKSISGIARMRDNRFDALVEMYKPKSEAPARINLDILPELDETSIREGRVFRDIAEMDALCLLVRSFHDDSVFHIKGSVNAKRDIEAVNEELALHDLLFIEKRFERIEKDRRSGKKDRGGLDNEEALLNRMKDHLEEGMHLRTFSFSREELKALSGYPLITLIPLIIILNVDESDMAQPEISDDLKQICSKQFITTVKVAAQFELEIDFLDENERDEFLAEAGIKESALARLSWFSMKSLGLNSFFTVGKDEVRQWLVRNGALAPEAAGVIHSDLERGFIRAEVMKYDDLITLGSEDEVKKDGKLMVMGKDYEVLDGDIISFRFNV